jgi:hypothetical protein
LKEEAYKADELTKTRFSKRQNYIRLSIYQPWNKRKVLYDGKTFWETCCGGGGDRGVDWVNRADRQSESWVLVLEDFQVVLKLFTDAVCEEEEEEASASWAAQSVRAVAAASAAEGQCSSLLFVVDRRRGCRFVRPLINLFGNRFVRSFFRGWSDRDVSNHSWKYPLEQQQPLRPQ